MSQVNFDSMSRAFSGFWTQGTEGDYQNMPYSVVKKLTKKEELRLQIELNSKDYLRFIESTETKAIRKDYFITALFLVAFVVLLALVQTALIESFTM